MAQQDSGLRLLGLIVGALALWFCSYIVALLGLNAEPAGKLARGGLVALAVVGFLPWIWTSVLAIRAQDEFTQRVHLVALASAFAFTAVLVFACDLLQRAHFLGELSLSTIWVVMVASWAAAIVLASRYYR